MVKRPVILVVDDKLLNVVAMVILVSKIGFAGDGSGSGADALEKIKLCFYSAIIMDLEMQDMSGFECTRKIRQTELGTMRRVPIIAYSSLSELSAIHQCLDAGMDALLKKGCSIEELSKILHQFIPEFPDLPNLAA